MKVSQIPGFIKADVAPEGEVQANSDVPPESTAPEATPDDFDGFFGDHFATAAVDPNAEGTAADGTQDVLGAIISQLSSHLSEDDFQDPKVPKARGIIADAEAAGIKVDETFLDALERNYLTLEDKVKFSIKKLKESKKGAEESGFADALQVYTRVIEKREKLLENIHGKKSGVRGGELAVIDNRKIFVENVFKTEMENLKEYGKAIVAFEDPLTGYGKTMTIEDDGTTNYTYYKMVDGAQQPLPSADEYYDAKPDPFSAKWGALLDINGDARIGQSDLYIAKKTTADGHEVTDIVSKTTGEAVKFKTDGSGELETVGDRKDRDYSPTFFEQNIELVTNPTIMAGYNDTEIGKNEIVVRLASDEHIVDGNGLVGAPITLNVPEFMRVKKDGSVPKLFSADGPLAQQKLGEEEDIGEWELKRIVSVEIEMDDALNGADGKDYLIHLKTEDDTTVTIRVTGRNSAASNFALSIIAGADRTSGIAIDAHSMTAKADFHMNETAINNLANYMGDATTREDIDAGAEPFKGSTHDYGLIVEGFHSSAIRGTSGKDIIITEAAKDEYRFNTSTDPNDPNLPSARHSTAVQGGLDQTFVLHKGGDFVGTEITTFIGGKDHDNIAINESNHAVYINNLSNEVAYIGNLNDATNTSWGAMDDTYVGLRDNPEKYAFAYIYAPELFENNDMTRPIEDFEDQENYTMNPAQGSYADQVGIPSTPMGGNGEIDPGTFSGIDPMDIDSVKAMREMQMSAIATAWKEPQLDTTEPLNTEYAFQGVQMDSVYANQMQDSQDATFAGIMALFDNDPEFGPNGE